MVFEASCCGIILSDDDFVNNVLSTVPQKKFAPITYSGTTFRMELNSFAVIAKRYRCPKCFRIKTVIINDN